MNQSGSLTARLDRYRTLDRRHEAAAPPPREAPLLRPAAAGTGMLHVPVRPAPDLAMRLSAAIGGEVDRGALGSVVRTAVSLRLPADLARLGSLPYPVDPAHPLICLDTETTGLGTAAGTVAFLVGLGRWDGDRFEVVQLLLPDHPDEPALLEALRAAIPPDAWLVTYNGRGFDWPLLVTRFRLHRTEPPEYAGHLDLLPVARQLWRHRLEDARLATVEAGVVGVRRGADLPGALIPARYLEFLASGRAEPLRVVVEHNRQDVVSLALLVAHLATHLADPEGRAGEHPGDVAALGRAFARRRRFEDALACCDAAVATARDAAQWEPLAAERARVLRLAGRHADSAAAWEEIAGRGGPLSAIAWVQLAKHLEHVARDPWRALAAAERATALVERQRLLGRELPRLEHDLARRRARLRGRVRRRQAAAPELVGTR